MRLSTTAAILVTLTCAIATPAFAQDPPKKDITLDQGKAGGPVLTREELRNCLARGAALKQLDAELVKEEATLTQVKADLDKLSAELAAQLDKVDRTSATAVDAFNAASKAREQQTDAYQARANAFNARLDARDAERTAYGPVCVNRRFRQEDAAAIAKEKAPATP